jgi:hypothetical protein
LQIELDKIVDRVRQTKESSVLMDHRRFTELVDEIDGTVDEVSTSGLTLKEYPGRVFRFSTVGTSAADMSARILGENNRLTREEVAREVEIRRRGMFRPGLFVLPQPKLSRARAGAEGSTMACRSEDP